MGRNLSRSRARRWIMIALYARAWVEIRNILNYFFGHSVALYARAWVEILPLARKRQTQNCRPLREGVGRNWLMTKSNHYIGVALYARAWVEIQNYKRYGIPKARRHLREGVGRNHVLIRWQAQPSGRPLREGVGRNAEMAATTICRPRSPSTRGRG